MGSGKGKNKRLSKEIEHDKITAIHNRKDIYNFLEQNGYKKGSYVYHLQEDHYLTNHPLHDLVHLPSSMKFNDGIIPIYTLNYKFVNNLNYENNISGIASRYIMVIPTDDNKFVVQDIISLVGHTGPHPLRVRTGDPIDKGGRFIKRKTYDNMDDAANAILKEKKIIPPHLEPYELSPGYQEQIEKTFPFIRECFSSRKILTSQQLSSYITAGTYFRSAANKITPEIKNELADIVKERNEQRLKIEEHEKLAIKLTNERFSDDKLSTIKKQKLIDIDKVNNSLFLQCSSKYHAYIDALNTNIINQAIELAKENNIVLKPDNFNQTRIW